MLSIPGYRITEEIYTGAKTTVYRGQREADQCPVVVKTTSAEYPALKDLARLQHEYALTSDWDEPGLIHAYALVSQQNTQVLILQDIGGVTIKQLLTDQATPPLPVARLLALALAFANSLKRIHQRQIIHKDINPNNLVVNALTDQVQIIDFGISSQLSRETPELQNPGHLEGTLAYISPEQTGRMNRTLDYRSDFYSLGATYYEMFTGVPPFTANDPMELVHCHLARTPRPAHELRPDLPPMLSELVQKLMAKTAEARYQSASGLIADLQICLTQYHTNQTITPFALGQQDVSGRFQIPQKLYGREREVQQVLDAFARVSLGRTEMLLVAGYSGIGKTSLVHEVYKPVTEKHGYFIAGKFGQFQHDIPYASLIEAFRELMRQLLTESPARILSWRTKLGDALGANVQVIIEVIPEVALILPPELTTTIPVLPPQEAGNRFQATLRQFIEVFAQPTHPLVLFLDDLQWADAASLRFLEELLQKSRKQCLLILGSYRDNEVHAAHPFMLTLESLRKAEASFSILSLQALSFPDLERLVRDTLTPALTSTLTSTLTSDSKETSTSDITSLTELIADKTGGNPFFVNAFLTALYEAGWLHFNVAKGGWQWDMAEIQAQQITDNVVDLMSRKLRTLAPATQNLLVQAACIGHQFDLATLAGIAGRSPAQVMPDLWEAVKARLVEQQGTFRIEEIFIDQGGAQQANGYRFRFIHDRVQQAAYELLPSAETTALHLKIGRLWLAQLAQLNLTAVDESLFAVVNQFHAARLLIQAPGERIELAKLNLHASRKAVSSTAFASALRYLTAGLDLLDGGDWEHQYELTLALSLERAECEYINHRHEAAMHYFKASLTHVKTVEEKARIHLKQMDLYGSQGDYKRAVKEGLTGLRELGIHLPLKPKKFHIHLELWKERWHRRGRKVKPLFDQLPLTEKSAHQLAIQLLAGIIPFSAATNGFLNALVMVKGVNYSYTHGMTPDTAYILMCFSSMIAGSRQYPLAWEYAQKALELCDTQTPLNQSETLLIFGSYINHWYQPMRTSAPYVEKSLSMALETGNWIFASMSAMQYIQAPFGMGVEVSKFKEQSQKCHDILTQINDPLLILSNFKFSIYWAACLEGADPNASFDSEGYSGPGLSTNTNTGLLYFTYILSSFYELVFGRFSEAATYLQKAKKFLFMGMGVSMFTDYAFLEILITLGAQYGVDVPVQDKQLDKQLREQQQRLQKNLQKLKGWAKQCPENYAHKYLLASAEMVRVAGRREQASELYDQAIDAAQQNGFIHHQALACECAARFHLQRNKAEFARIYLEKARYLYAKWGAYAKVRQLDNQYPDLSQKATRALATTTILSTRTTTYDGTRLLDSAALDLDSVMKATQAISGEIVLGHLLKKLMRIAIENAGAQHGFLLLETAGEWRIEAEGNVNQATVRVLQSLPLIAPIQTADVAANDSPVAPLLPVSLIQYVARTKEALVLDHAAGDGRFINDPYILQSRVKSVLCAPILHHGKLAGILYLENQLVEGAFTEGRLEILRILSSQAAISIDNARVYENLESTVAQRTAALSIAFTAAETARQQAESAEQKATKALADLRATQTQLIQSEKMASLGQLVAGVAHELNTPIGNALITASTLVDASNELKTAMLNGEMRKSTLTHFVDNVVPMADMISRSCQTAATLISSFKQVAADQTSEQRRTFELGSLVEDNISSLRAGFKDKPWIIKIEIPSGIICDSYPGPLGQVITNLVQNAVVHGFAGRETGLITITASASADTVEMIFLDDGKGMDAAILARIFEPFYTSRLGQGGSGLGLSISLNIVTGVLGGTLQAASEPGCGAQFSLVFPKNAANR